MDAVFLGEAFLSARFRVNPPEDKLFFSF